MVKARGADPVAPATRPLDELIPYIGNARTHTEAQVAQLERSMVEFGWTVPVLVDPDGGVIAGHGRLLAAERIYGKGQLIRGLNGKPLPKGEVPVLVAEGWTDAQKRAYVIADNKLALNADWDEAALADELRALDDFDLGLTGFSKSELDALLDDDPIGEPPESKYSEQFGVVVICEDETEQRRVYERLAADGLTLKVVKV